MLKFVILAVQRLTQSCAEACVKSFEKPVIVSVVNYTIHKIVGFYGDLLDLYKQAIMAKQQVEKNLIHIIYRPYNNNILSI
ncbi:MAG TPA: hypothetical protein PKB09_00360 [Candidatus Saccharibacteria bacterium]|nr:hypothetical protein [Candidatus Saccharibacteria bacterium]